MVDSFAMIAMKDSWGPAVRSRLWIVAVALLAAGVALRFYGVSTRLPWEDEVYYLKQSSLDQPLTDAPLSTFLLRQFVLATDTTFFNLYLFAALWGSAALISFLLLARHVSTRPEFLLGSLSFMAFSPVAVFYSQAGRPYALLLFITPLVLLTFLGAYRRGSLGDWIWFLIVASAGTCIHLVMIPFLAALCLAVGVVTLVPGLEQRRCSHSWRRLLLMIGVSGVAVGVGLLDLQSPESNSYLIEKFRPYDAGFFPFVRAFVDGLGSALLPETGPLSPRDAVGVALLSFAILGGFQLRRDGQADLSLILCCAIVVPGTVMYLTLGHMYFWPWLRYVCHLSVPFALLCVCGVRSVIKWGADGARLSGFQLALMVALFPAYSSASFKMWRQEARDGWGGSLQVAARRACDNKLPKLTGYMSAWDRTADLIWFNFSGCERPPIYLLKEPNEGGLFKQQDTPGPRPGELLPGYAPAPPSSIQPGRYLLATGFWMTVSCSDIQRKLDGAFVASDVTASEASIAGFSNLRLCELTRP